MTNEPLPIARAGRGARWSRTLAAAVSLVIAGIAMTFARGYRRPAPLAEPRPPGMTVGVVPLPASTWPGLTIPEFL